MTALKLLEDNKLEKQEVRQIAAGLRTKLENFESVFIGIFWNVLLERFQKTHPSLQSVGIDMGIVSGLFASLIAFVDTLRADHMFNEFIEKAKNITAEEYEYDKTRRPVRKRAFHEIGTAEEVLFTGKEKLKVEVYFASLDKLRTELTVRHAAYVDLSNRFLFLINIKHSSQKDIIEGAKNFAV